MPKSIGFWRTIYVTWTQSFVSVCLAVSEKTGGQTDKQTNKLDQSQDIVTGNANPQVDLRRGMSFSNIKISFLAT